MILNVQTRDTSQKPRSLRKKGVLPGVIYGRKEQATAIAMSYIDFDKVFKTAGESSVITLKGLDKDKEVLIHMVELDPVSSRPLHADFYAIEKGQTVTVSVPLEFEGVSPAVKDLGGVLVKVLHEIEVEVLPKELPHKIVVDMTVLKNIGDQVHIKDLTFPESAKITLDGNEVVAMVAMVEEEKEEVTPIDITQIEVQERGKKEEESTEPSE